MEIKRKRWIVMSGDDVLCGDKNYYDFVTAEKIGYKPIKTFTSKGRALSSARRLKEFKDREIKAVEVEEIYRV